ncbi:hypothetical protein QFZ56_000054 [Streptomyces achromogenes]|uniref:Uncharacterized protein n=1 Tax=Streptomyces achromogenes TaxID=67255 RepID=A0ABU0PSI9_STRAH|nr:hypothetical protein [Streptomyces achromogenes]MDQ0681091.1 hypothetical protein [Streptomyces achromogenes]
MTEGSGDGQDAQRAAGAREPVSNELRRAANENQRQQRRDLLIGLPILGIAIIALMTSSIVNSERESNYEPTFSWLWLIIPITVFIAVAVVMAVRESDRRAEYEQKEIDERIEQEAREAESDTQFESGLQINRSLLTRYHDLSTQQARASFRLAHYVMVATAALLIGGTVAAVRADSTTASVTIAALAGLASALSGYISSTLIKSYQVAVQQAQVYFREPLAGGYLLSAERLASNFTDETAKAQAMQEVISGLVQAAVGVAQSEQNPQQDALSPVILATQQTQNSNNAAL